MIRIIKISFLLFLAFVFIFSAGFVSAAIQLEVNFPDFGEQKISSESSLPQTLKYVFTVVVIICALAVLFSLIYGGIMYLGSTGNPETMASGRKRIVNSFLGLIILFASYLLLRTVNPELLILRIDKKPVISGIILLNKAAFEHPDIKQILSDPNADDKELSDTLQKMLDPGPQDEPRAVYLPSSVSDIGKAFGFGDIEVSNDKREWTFVTACLGFIPLPWSKDRPDPRMCYNPTNLHFDYNFKDFRLWGLYFLPGAKAKVLSYRSPEFSRFLIPIAFWLDLPGVKTKEVQKYKDGLNDADFEYVYPDCSAEKDGPCQFKLLDENEWGEEHEIPGIIDPTRAVFSTAPMSLMAQRIDPGVVLYSDKLGQHLALNDIGGQSKKLEEQNFNDQTQKIEIINREEDEENEKQIKTSNFLAVLHNNNDFEGELRLFFEKFEPPKIGGLPDFGEVGNLPKGAEDIEENKTFLSQINGKVDIYGRVDGVSSVQVFEMPNTDEEWAQWQENGGCKVKICANIATENAIENKTLNCLVYNISPELFFEAPYDKIEKEKVLPLFIPKNIPEKHFVDNDEDKIPDDLDNNGTNGDEGDRVKFADNINSLFIEGSCAVVLFENKVALNKSWQDDGPGAKSEFFSQQSAEYLAEKLYPNLTPQNPGGYHHEIGRCGCTAWEGFDRFFHIDCDSCASAIAVYPIK